MDEAVALLENFLANVKGDENLLNMMKQNWVLEKMNAKTNKKANESAIQMYAIYGPKNPMTTDLLPAQIMALTSDELIAAVKDLLSHKHTVVYYGPETKEEMVKKLPEMHKVAENLAEFGPSNVFKAWSTQTPCVYLAPYKANQINMYKIISYDDAEYNP